jgi:hypothetical protein
MAHLDLAGDEQVVQVTSCGIPVDTPEPDDFSDTESLRVLLQEVGNPGSDLLPQCHGLCNYSVKADIMIAIPVSF